MPADPETTVPAAVDDDVSAAVPPHHVRVALADQLGSAESPPVHGPADLAAGLAANLVDHGEFRSALEELRNAITALVPPPDHMKASDALGALVFSSTDAARAGARLGFALGRMESAMHLGWDAWLRAAVAELERSGCSVESHLAAEAIAYLAADMKTLERADMAQEPGPTVEPGIYELRLAQMTYRLLVLEPQPFDSWINLVGLDLWGAGSRVTGRMLTFIAPIPAADVTVIARYATEENHERGSSVQLPVYEGLEEI